MLKWFLVALWSFWLLISPVDAFELGLVTGSPTGTYYKIGEDLQKLVSAQLAPNVDVTLKVYASSGALANMLQVYQARGVHLALIQADGLAYIKELSANPDLQRIARKLKLVLGLFNEEIHVLVARESNIKAFADLAGKSVAVGPKDSGTYLTASFLFELAQEKPAHALELPYEDALKKLKKGEIDALMWVGGAPLPMLKDSVKTDDKLRLVPLTDKSLEFYTPTSIPAGTYDWQEEAVPTLGVPALLMAFDYQGEACEAIGRLARLVHDHIEWLRTHGHPKWRAVQLDGPLPPGWERYSCVERALHRSAGSPSNAGAEPRNPITEALKNMLKLP